MWHSWELTTDLNAYIWNLLVNFKSLKFYIFDHRHLMSWERPLRKWHLTFLQQVSVSEECVFRSWLKLLKFDRINIYYLLVSEMPSRRVACKMGVMMITLVMGRL